MGGFKFRRQHPIGTYIVDFYCHQARLAIEIDGGQHNQDDQRLYDERRTAYLEAQGIYACASLLESPRPARDLNKGVLEVIRQVLVGRQRSGAR
jgi:very-short-patch-repair endonuclease